MNTHIPQVSQSSLNLWQACPRKFQHQVLDNFHLPSELNTKMEQGRKFHLLMQQRELGLDITNLAASDPQLQNWIAAFEHNPPVMIEGGGTHPTGNRHAEHLRTYKLNSYMLTAIYDLLILGGDQAQILDWKTHDQPISAAVLSSNWQTRLYLYILVATTDYLPEQILMSYWFANTGTTVAIAYNQSEHDQTERELIQILSEMTDAKQADYYPQLSQGNERCTKCEFKYRCERSHPINLGAISTFPEVPI